MKLAIHRLQADAIAVRDEWRLRSNCDIRTIERLRDKKVLE